MKAEYEAAERRKREAEELTMYTFQKKKGIHAEKKRVEEQKDEAEHFEALRSKWQDLRRDNALWQLYHIERDAQALETEKLQVAAKLDEEQERQKEPEQAMSAEKQEQVKKMILKIKKQK